MFPIVLGFYSIYMLWTLFKSLSQQLNIEVHSPRDQTNQTFDKDHSVRLFDRPSDILSQQQRQHISCCHSGSSGKIYFVSTTRVSKESQVMKRQRDTTYKVDLSAIGLESRKPFCSEYSAYEKCCVVCFFYNIFVDY